MHKPLSIATLDLMRAREMIDEPEKWIKGQEYQLTVEGVERRCVLRAIFDSTNVGSASYQRHKNALDLFLSVLPRGYESIDAFNDSSQISHERMIETFNLAIYR